MLALLSLELKLCPGTSFCFLAFFGMAKIRICDNKKGTKGGIVLDTRKSPEKCDDFENIVH